MALIHSPRLVTNGLTLALDAANVRSYPGTGTSWFDLSGFGNTGTLINGPTYNSNNSGSLVFDGVNDFATIPGNSSFAFGGNGTVEMWVYITGNNGVNNRFWSVNNNSSSLDAYLNGSSYNIGLHGGVVLTTTTIPQNSWVQFLVTYTSGTIRVYFNRTEQSLTGVTTGYNINNSGLMHIARFTEASYEIEGRISNFKIYNRALTASEITQNYNATKGRYGL